MRVRAHICDNHLKKEIRRVPMGIFLEADYNVCSVCIFLKLFHGE